MDKVDAAFPRFEIRDQRRQMRGIPPKPFWPIIVFSCELPDSDRKW